MSHFLIFHLPSFIIFSQLALMTLVLIKGCELCVLDAAPDAWTGEMVVPPNQAYTLLFFLHLSLCKKKKIITSFRLKPRAGEDVISETCVVYHASRLWRFKKKCLRIHRGENIKYVCSNKEKEWKCKHQPVASQHAMYCFLEARLTAQAYTACVWFVLGCLKCRTRQHRMDPCGPGSLIRKTRAPVLKLG